MEWVGAYQQPNTMKYKKPVGVSATTSQLKQLWLCLYGVLGQAPFNKTKRLKLSCLGILLMFTFIAQLII